MPKGDSTDLHGKRIGRDPPPAHRACWLLLLAGCASVSPGAPPPCAALSTGGPGPESSDEIAELLEQVQEALYPELSDIDIALATGSDPGSFFWANLVLETLTDPPRERSYLVYHSVELLDDPPTHDAVVAILAHELAHVRDYTEMDSTELAEFAVWYATSDVSAYERETDQVSVALGCGPGLIGYRAWLYDRVDDETEAQKRIDYLTPGEIAVAMSRVGGAG